VSAYACSILALRDDDGSPLLPSGIPIGGVVRLKREGGSRRNPARIAAYHHRRKVGYLPSDKLWIWTTLTRSKHTAIVVGQISDEAGGLVALDVEISVAEPAAAAVPSLPRQQRRMLRMMPAFAALALTFATFVALERVDVSTTAVQDADVTASPSPAPQASKTEARDSQGARSAGAHSLPADFLAGETFAEMRAQRRMSIDRRADSFAAFDSAMRPGAMQPPTRTLLAVRTKDDALLAFISKPFTATLSTKDDAVLPFVPVQFLPTLGTKEDDIVVVPASLPFTGTIQTKDDGLAVAPPALSAPKPKTVDTLAPAKQIAKPAKARPRAKLVAPPPHKQARKKRKPANSASGLSTGKNAAASPHW